MLLYLKQGNGSSYIFGQALNSLAHNRSVHYEFPSISGQHSHPFCGFWQLSSLAMLHS